MRFGLVALVIVGCGNKTDAPGPVAGSGSTVVASGSAVVGDAGSPSGAGSAGASSDLELKPGEKLHDPVTVMPWIPPAGHMKVTLVDVDGAPASSRLVVWGDGKRHDVVNVKTTCLTGEHGAELSTGAKNTVLFRCESQGKTDIVADEWLIRWQDGKGFPTIYRHWRGGRFQRDPKWAGARQRYPEQEVDDNDPSQCCCSWEDEGEDSFEITSRRYCKGSQDHHGVCVADSKCKKPDDE